jgi:hypothetical protein
LRSRQSGRSVFHRWWSGTARHRSSRHDPSWSWGGHTSCSALICSVHTLCTLQ